MEEDGKHKQEIKGNVEGEEDEIVDITIVKRTRGHHLEARMKGTLCKVTKTTQPTYQIK